MIAKGCAALFSLYLALALVCSSNAANERKSPTPPQPAPTEQAATACGLLTSDDIEAVQGEGVKDAKGGVQTSGPLVIAQCFYMTPSFNKSVSLTLTQKNAASAEAGGPKEFWKQQFGGRAEREKRREAEERTRGRSKDRGERTEREEEEEEGQPAQRVKGVGDEAYWVGNQKFGVLYVLKGERFLRISIGGPEEQQVKIEKMKALAKRALKRLGRG